MVYVDSIFNANVKLCKEHHVGHPAQHSKDRRGDRAVGVHNVPLPVFLYQLFCDWEHWDMFAGTTGTIAVAPHPTQPGSATVLHVDAAHPDKRIVDAGHRRQTRILPPDNKSARAAHRSAKFAHRTHAD